MKTSADGLALIKHFEGLRLAAYPDPATGGDPITIGVGHTGPEVHLGLVWTEPEADAALAADLDNFERAVTVLCTYPIVQCQFDALVSFAFNCGRGNLASSTLLRKINAGDMNAAADQFPVWDKANHKVMPGLVKRRRAERALFLGLNWREAIA